MDRLKFLIFPFFLLFCCQGIGSQNKIKLAIVDNFQYQKYVSTQYKSYYIQSLDLAIDRARGEGLDIEYKIFEYRQDPVSVLQKIPEIIAWEPDVILGPRISMKTY